MNLNVEVFVRIHVYAYAYSHKLVKHRTKAIYSTVCLVETKQADETFYPNERSK